MQVCAASQHMGRSVVFLAMVFNDELSRDLLLGFRQERTPVHEAWMLRLVCVCSDWRHAGPVSLPLVACLLVRGAGVMKMLIV